MKKESVPKRIFNKFWHGSMNKRTVIFISMFIFFFTIMTMGLFSERVNSRRAVNNVHAIISIPGSEEVLYVKVKNYYRTQDNLIKIATEDGIIYRSSPMNVLIIEKDEK